MGRTPIDGAAAAVRQLILGKLSPLKAYSYRLGFRAGNDEHTTKLRTAFERDKSFNYGGCTTPNFNEVGVAECKSEWELDQTTS